MRFFCIFSILCLNSIAFLFSIRKLFQNNGLEIFGNTWVNKCSLVISEMTHKIRSRPEKRVGGGGFGHYKSMNKTDDKKRKFRQVDRNQVNKKKFERWIVWFQFFKLFHIVLVYTNKFEVKKFFYSMIQSMTASIFQ